MKSYTTLRNLAGSLSNQIDSTSLTLFDQLINDGYRKILGARDWPFAYKTDATMRTVASTQFGEMPDDMGRLLVPTVTVGSLIYTPRECPSERYWQELNMNTYTSDIPVWYLVRGTQLGLWPTPNTSSNVITLYYKQLVKDLSIADYTTGGILTAIAASTAIVGTGTTWTAAMAGRYLRITDSDTANKGDGFWYPISSSGSATAITLTKPYTGASIATGNAAYTIGQMPILPEAYHDMPVDYAMWQFWVQQGELARATTYQQAYDLKMKQLVAEFGTRSSNPVIDDGGPTNIINPNLTYRL